MAAMRILVVDDDVDFADGLAEVLQLLGHETETVNSGEDGLALARRSAFGFAFVDVGLPRINGIDCVRELKRDQANLECVLMTGYGKESLRVSDIDELGVIVLTKPITVERISEILADL